jgi:hypothetical protein
VSGRSGGKKKGSDSPVEDIQERDHRHTDRMVVGLGEARAKAHDDSSAEHHPRSRDEPQRASPESLHGKGSPEGHDKIPYLEAAVDSHNLGGIGDPDGFENGREIVRNDPVTDPVLTQRDAYKYRQAVSVCRCAEEVGVGDVLVVLLSLNGGHNLLVFVPHKGIIQVAVADEPSQQWESVCGIQQNTDA